MQAKKPSLKNLRHVLLIEDNVDHAELLTELVDKYASPVVVHAVETFADAVKYLSKTTYDFIFTAGTVRGESILLHVDRLLELAAGAPFTVITGSGNERLAADLTKRGITEYLVKSRETLEAIPALIQKMLGMRKHRATPPRRLRPKERGPKATEKTLHKDILRMTTLAENLLKKTVRRKSQTAFDKDVRQLCKNLLRVQTLFFPES
ncbi:MAG: response regulator [Deltaproteobacteria bacterium]|nr:response regulator [Deltaproteobacteria bacterium]